MRGNQTPLFLFFGRLSNKRNFTLRNFIEVLP
jgi:hypothetical protein